MGRRRQLLIASITGGVLIAIGATVLVVRGGGHGGRVHTTAATAPTSTSSTEPLETTLVLEPVSDPGTTAAPPAPTTTSTTTLAAALSGQGAVLGAPTVPDTRVMHSSGCASLADPGNWNTQCGQLGPNAVWLTETRSGSQSNLLTGAYVLVRASGSSATTAAPAAARATPSTTTSTTAATRATTTTSTTAAQLGPGDSLWTVALEERDGTGGRFTGLAATAGGVRGDGSQAVLFGFHQGSSPGVLSADLVEVPPAAPSATVSVHLDLTKGAARISTGQLDIWAASYITGDATCCPSAYTHQVIHFQASAWRVVATARISPASVPPSQV